jgi:chemotaxis protein histidine kinase CheA
MIIFKVTCNGLMRRYTTSDDVQWQSLYAQLCEQFSVERGSVSYTDDDGDRVTISSDAELQESFGLGCLNEAGLVMRFVLDPSANVAPPVSTVSTDSALREYSGEDGTSSEWDFVQVAGEPGYTMLPQHGDDRDESDDDNDEIRSVCSSSSEVSSVVMEPVYPDLESSMAQHDDETDEETSVVEMIPMTFMAAPIEEAEPEEEDVKEAVVIAEVQSAPEPFVFEEEPEETKEQEQEEEEVEVEQEEETVAHDSAAGPCSDTCCMSADVTPEQLASALAPSIAKHLEPHMTSLISSVCTSTSSSSAVPPAAPLLRSLPLHRNVLCDHCQQRIAGVRFKCGNCGDFDLCEACEQLPRSTVSHDASHIFLKVYRPLTAIFRSPILPHNLYETVPTPAARSCTNTETGHGQLLSDVRAAASSLLQMGSMRAKAAAEARQQSRKRAAEKLKKEAEEKKQKEEAEAAEKKQKEEEEKAAAAEAAEKKMKADEIAAAAAEASAAAAAAEAAKEAEELRRAQIASKKAMLKELRERKDALAHADRMRVREEAKAKLEAMRAAKAKEQAAEAQAKKEKDTAAMTASRLSARFVRDVTYADGEQIEPGTFTKTWLMQNTGATQWPEGVSLQCIGGNLTGKTIKVPALKSGEQATLSVDLLAPSQPGRYQSYWRLMYDGNGFGHRTWADVVVADPASGKKTVAFVPKETVIGAMPAAQAARQVTETDPETQPEAGSSDASEPLAAPQLPEAAVAAAPAPVDAAPQYDEEVLMRQLFDMGFFSRTINQRLLRAYNGDLSAVVQNLLHDHDHDWSNRRH